MEEEDEPVPVNVERMPDTTMEADSGNSLTVYFSLHLLIKDLVNLYNVLK